MNNSHSDIEAVLAIYALGALGSSESRLVKEHLITCDICRSELKDLQKTTLYLDAVFNQAAPASIWTSIEKELNPDPIPLPIFSRKNFHVFRIAAPIAAALVAVVLIGSSVFQTDTPEITNQVQEFALVTPSNEKLAQVTLEGNQGKITNPPPDNSEHSYQLWSLSEESSSPISLGLVASDTTYFTLDPSVHSIAISKEPHGGSASPTNILAMKEL